MLGQILVFTHIEKGRDNERAKQKWEMGVEK